MSRMEKMTWQEVRGGACIPCVMWHRMPWGGTGYLAFDLSWFSLLLFPLTSHLFSPFPLLLHSPSHVLIVLPRRLANLQKCVLSFPRSRNITGRKQARQRLHFLPLLEYRFPKVGCDREMSVISGWDSGEWVCLLWCSFPLPQAWSERLWGFGEVVSTFAYSLEPGGKV